MENVLLATMQLLEDIKNVRSFEDSSQKLLDEFDKLDLEGRREYLLRIEKEYGNDVQKYMMLLSFLLEDNVKQEVVDAIDKCLEEGVFDYIYYLSCRIQYEANLFIRGLDYDKRKHWISKQKQIKKETSVLRNVFSEQLEWLPFDKRNNKKVIMFVSPLLSERHAPTYKMINLYSIMNKLGYDITVISINTADIALATTKCLKNTYTYNSLYSQTGGFCQQMAGVSVKGIHLEFTPENILHSTNLLLDVVKECNPLFCIEFGADDFLIDFCREITDIISFPMTTTTPANNAKIYLSVRKDVPQKWKAELPPQKQVLFVDYRDNIMVECPEEKKTFLEKNNNIMAVIVGNRLDDEVSEEFVEMLENVLEQIEELIIVFVGECKKLERRISERKYQDRFIFTGLVLNLEELTSSCDIYINTPRVGGASSARMAIKAGIPVITLPECDVAFNVGSDFCVSSISEMGERLIRYCRDKDYYRAHCEQIATKYIDKDDEYNQQAISQLIDTICSIIKSE